MDKKCKSNIISFGHINLYILLIPFGVILDNLLDIIRKNSTKLSLDNYKENQHPIIITINYALSLCLSFIFFIIYRVSSKSDKIKKSNFIDKLLNKYNNNRSISIKEKFLWILLGSILHFVSFIIYSYNWFEIDYYLTYSASNILLMVLFSFWQLKMKII